MLEKVLLFGKKIKFHEDQSIVKASAFIALLWIGFNLNELSFDIPVSTAFRFVGVDRMFDFSPVVALSIVL